MESLPLSTPIPQNNNSKKRLNAASLLDAEVVEVLPTTPRSSKSQKIKDEVLYDEVIDVDSNEDSTDIAVISTEVNTAMKGKAIIDVSDGDLNGLVEVVEEGLPISTVDDQGSDDLCDDDDDYNADDYMDYLLGDDDKGGSAVYDHLQSQFDNIDVPTGVETSVPWLPDPSSQKVDQVILFIHRNQLLKIKMAELLRCWIHRTSISLILCSDMNILEDLIMLRIIEASSSAVPPKHWAKRIQEEWKILEKDLPETIFVRVYEERMDLLRAVILGAEGTPYHDGLFFFDVQFPSN